MAWRSFRTRLIVGSIVWILAAIGVSGFALSQLFREHVTKQFDAELVGHADELVALVDLDAEGRPYLHRRLSDPRFLPPGSGFYWQIEHLHGPTTVSGSLSGHALVLTPIAHGQERRTFVPGPHGPVRLLERRVDVSGEPLRFAIGVDEHKLDEVLGAFNRTLALSLGVIATGLILAAALQVGFGLQPMSRVRAALADVRAGRVRRLPEDSPSEVLPLVHDLNALLDANAEMVRRARTQAGNLAHALKSPLAIMMDEGEQLRRAGQTEAAEAILTQCERMRRQIDFQMARARAAASRSAPGAVAGVRSSVEPVVEAMRRLHGARQVSFALEIPDELKVAVEAQDLSEMCANLLDNAGKWASSCVRVRAEPGTAGMVRIVVEDDGPGLPPESWEVAFDIGERLDERVHGSGLGLPIVRDLATLYGGRVWLEDSRLGGLAAVLDLPTAPA